MKTAETLKLSPGDRVYLAPSLPLGGQNATVHHVMGPGRKLPEGVLGVDVPIGYVLIQPDSSQFKYWHAPVELWPERTK